MVERDPTHPPLAGKIDVHHHIIPPVLAQAIEQHGLTAMAGAAEPEWSAERSIALMDAQGIACAITSVSAPGVYLGDRQQAQTLARACNEFSAELSDRHPTRFGSFATLPMPLPEASCQEAVHALDHLGAAGIVLLASNDGIYLGDPRFEELLTELDRRAATVFIHPNLHPSSQGLGLEAPGFLIEFLCDTTRAALNLVLTGSLERHPNIRWILAHAGGFLPYVAWRMSLANLDPKFAKAAPQGVLSYLRRFYFDTALSTSTYAMAALSDFAANDRILFGSDFPYAPAPMTALQIQSLQEIQRWDDDTRGRVFRGNALSLFPALARPDEPPARAAIPAAPSGMSRIKRLAMRSAVGAIEAIRNR